MKRRLAHDRKDGMRIRRKSIKLEHSRNVTESPTSSNEDESFQDSESQVLDFEPISFIRCHSRNRKDAADVSTQVWQCSFEPDVDSNATTKFVATCGANSVCIIDVSTGKVFRKYHAADNTEMFYALTWTTLKGSGSCLNTNILAVGGALGTIHLIHPDTDQMFLEHKIQRGRNFKKFISGLLFSKNQPNILFCSSSVGEVYIFDIGQPFPPNYVKSITLRHTLDARSTELFHMSLSRDMNILLAAGNEGLYGWQMPSKISADMSLPTRMKFYFPASEAAERAPNMVDSVVAMDGTVVATKCALHGVIYTWDLDATINSAQKKRKNHEYDVTPMRTLAWSDTDNFFMNMGFSAAAGLLACGDDKGAIWLYDTSTFNNDTLVKPTALLPWPELEDMFIASKRKLSLDVYDIVVDQVTLDSRGEYLVAVTANNMVCIWKRCRAM